MTNEHLYHQPGQLRCAGLRDDEKGSEVKVYHQDGSITYEPATYWYNIQRDKRKEYRLRGVVKRWRM